MCMKSDRLQLWYNLIRSAACLYVRCMCGFLWLLCQKMFPQSSFYASSSFFFFFYVFMNPQKSHSVVRFYSQGFSVD